MSAWQCWQESEFEGRRQETEPEGHVSQFKVLRGRALTRAFFALWRPRVCGKLRDQWVEVPKIEQRTFEQLHVVDFVAVGELKLFPQERVRQLVDCMKVGNVSRSRRTCFSACLLSK